MLPAQLWQQTLTASADYLISQAMIARWCRSGWLSCPVACWLPPKAASLQDRHREWSTLIRSRAAYWQFPVVSDRTKKLLSGRVTSERIASKKEVIINAINNEGKP